jgi:hypothetical protein
VYLSLDFLLLLAHLIVADSHPHIPFPSMQQILGSYRKRNAIPAFGILCRSMTLGLVAAEISPSPPSPPAAKTPVQKSAVERLTDPLFFLVSPWNDG